jgi:pimeloyl-ACP methyl ester carboxylesterase
MIGFALVLLAPLAIPVRAQVAERTVGDVYQRGEEAAWVFEADGTRIGHHTSRYVGRDELAGRDAHHFQGTCRLLIEAKSGVELRSLADLWTDDRGLPVRFVQQLLVGDAYSRVDLDVAGAKSKARIVQGASKREITVDVDPAAYLLANNYVSHIEILLALAPEGADVHAQIFSGNALQGLAYDAKAVGSFDEDVAGVRRRGTLYEDSLGESLRFAAGRLLEVGVASQKLVIRRTTEHFDSFTIQAPEVKKRAAEFDAEDVRIRRGDAEIAGTVTKRKGSQGRLPAVFFVSGSGPQDRDGISSGMDLGTHEILDHLTSRGFLVLRVDDRGTGESSPMPASTSFLDLVADAEACVDHLSKRADVDPKRIVLIGHSEGGETVPILAVRHPEIAAIVLMAAPGRPILEVILDQNRAGLVEEGLAGEALEAKLGEVRAFLVRLASDEAIDPATLDAEERAALASRAWFQSHAQQDPAATIAKVRCPVLVLQGAKDFQVSPERDARALEKALADAKHADHELHVFAGLDHLFKKAPGERSEIADYWKSRPVDAEFLAVLTAWLEKRVSTGGR